MSKGVLQVIPTSKQDELTISQFVDVMQDFANPYFPKPTFVKTPYVAAFSAAMWEHVEFLVSKHVSRGVDEGIAKSDKDREEIRALCVKMQTTLDEHYGNEAARIEEIFAERHEQRVKAFRETLKRERNDSEAIVDSDKVFYDGEHVNGSSFPPKVQAALDAIAGIVGQPHLKEHFDKLCYKSIKQQRLEKLDPDGDYGPSSYHMVFRGKPGTGKTMIAGMVGNLLKALGVIPSSKFKVVQLHEMKAKFLGQTPHSMNDTFRNPGVYFIDEAYTIMRRKDDSFGAEILGALCEMLENRRGEVVVIMAGYKVRNLFGYGSQSETHRTLFRTRCRTSSSTTLVSSHVSIGFSTLKITRQTSSLKLLNMP